MTWVKDKNRYTKCCDCKIKIERFAPNQKRCKDCAYKKTKEIATKRLKKYPEKNRENFKRWYYMNLDRERKVRLERWHARFDKKVP